jgi:hypothetical protein
VHIINRLLAIAAAACVGLVPAVGAERGNSTGTGSKHPSSHHRGSSRGSKAVADRSPRSSGARSHTLHRTSGETHLRPNHQRSDDRETGRVDDDMIRPDANVQVELPDHENDGESENDASNDDQTSILFGGATDNDGGPRP